MFSIPSLPKLIVLIGIITAIWYGFRLVGALDRARRQAERMARQAPGQAPRQTSQQRRADVANVEDTVKCRVCGAYVPARQPSRCNRSDCPF
jgi:hypothetical protein